MASKTSKFKITPGNGDSPASGPTSMESLSQLAKASQTPEQQAAAEISNAEALKNKAFIEPAAESAAPSGAWEFDAGDNITEINMFLEAMKELRSPLEEGIIEKKVESPVTASQANKRFSLLSNSLGVHVKGILILTYQLFLKGAANKGAPGSLSATISSPNGEKITMLKEMLLHDYKMVCKNAHLRRLAEFLATDISIFAFSNKLQGDLAPKRSALIRPGEEPLSLEERAWCSSFNQKNPDCIISHIRVHTLLQLEYRMKFQGDKGNKKKTPSKPAQRKKQKNKRNK